MGLIDKELKQKHAAEERLLRFAEFVREQKAKGSPGMSRACLLSEGYRDFYGQVVFAYGMHRSLWILPAGENPKVLLFSRQEEAQAYAKKAPEDPPGQRLPLQQGPGRAGGGPHLEKPSLLQTLPAHPFL